MHAAGELGGQHRIDHAVAFEPALPLEGRRHDMQPEVRLPAGPMPGMPLVQVGLVDDLEAFRGESLGQLIYDQVGRLHASD